MIHAGATVYVLQSPSKETPLLTHRNDSLSLPFKLPLRILLHAGLIPLPYQSFEHHNDEALLSWTHQRPFAVTTAAEGSVCFRQCSCASESTARALVSMNLPEVPTEEAEGLGFFWKTAGATRFSDGTAPAPGFASTVAVADKFGVVVFSDLQGTFHSTSSLPWPAQHCACDLV